MNKLSVINTEGETFESSAYDFMVHFSFNGSKYEMKRKKC